MPVAKQTILPKEEEDSVSDKMEDENQLEISNDDKDLSDSPDEREESMVAVDCHGERVEQLAKIVT